MPILLNPWSYSYIRKLAEEATYLAKVNNLRPILSNEAATHWVRNKGKRFNIPLLGDYVPEGWERVEEIGFVDTTGTAKTGDPAMPMSELYERILQHPGLGLGIIEQGQNKVLVAIYRKGGL